VDRFGANFFQFFHSNPFVILLLPNTALADDVLLAVNKRLPVEKIGGVFTPQPLAERGVQYDKNGFAGCFGFDL
jgi:hypothetical protein